ncbi:MAG: hypothetical protein JSS83_16715 [Cyanobacteria bacterium SZAS LIN-3]|nr:hypothetical protein [Cyanobacteria bacterium SZAS LIN-3]MBS2006155.1 hypothetical protein [Cyanobacteria bacterium SZAS TMP-1]
MANFEVHDYEEYRFVFKFDDEFPDLLHIWVRHTKTVEDAIEVWFEGSETWNAERERFETKTETTGIYWFWLEENRVIMIISCFDR